MILFLLSWLINKLSVHSLLDTPWKLQLWTIHKTNCLLIAVYTAVSRSPQPSLISYCNGYYSRSMCYFVQTDFWNPLCLIIVLKKGNLTAWEGRKNSHLKLGCTNIPVHNDIRVCVYTDLINSFRLMLAFKLSFWLV